MKSHVIYISICLILFPLIVHADDKQPALRDSTAQLVGLIQSMAEENVEMAKINVLHDVAHKRLRIFTSTTSTSVKIGDSVLFGYDLEIVLAPSAIAYKTGVGSYRFQNDNQILSFAAAQFVSGKKTFARRLVGILAEAEPDLGWSTPTHPMMTIQQIIAGLQKDDDTVKEFLTDESDEWAETASKYGPD